MMAKHERRALTGDRNQCTGCGEFFNSSGAFDHHRIGPFTSRRCLSAEEMQAKGMALNGAGYWVKSLMSDEAKRARRAGANAAPSHHHDATSGV
jgi:hypothetical protein